MPYLFEWDPAKAADNLQKHGVSFDEANEAFGDPLSLNMPDPNHAAREERFLCSAFVVVDYNAAWAATFDSLRARIWPVVGDLALAIEHLGSTSVPGLAAKPVVDMAVVVPAPDAIPLAIERLATLGYVHRGNLGIEGREAFRCPIELPAHHLYLCPAGSLGLLNPLAVRDYLRIHADVARAYGDLKKSLALKFPDDIDSYIDGKRT